MAEKSGGIFHELNRLLYGDSRSSSIFRESKDNLNFVQRLELTSKLNVHSGCVNTTCWNESGSLLLSGSDDQHLVVTDPYTEDVITSVHTGHRANIFCARFLPCTSDNEVVSCSGDGKICYTNLEYGKTDGTNLFDCHVATTYKVAVVPGDPHTFLSCGEDGTVRWFDLRTKTSCLKDDCKEDVLINCGRAASALGVNPMSPWQLAVGCADSSIRVYDRRMLSTPGAGVYPDSSLHSLLHCFSPPGLANTNKRITCLVYSHTGGELLASYSSDSLYLFNLRREEENLEFAVEDNAQRPIQEEVVVTSSPPEPNRLFVDEGASPGQSQHAAGIQRLRLRGDWSDTGPEARPERERDPQTEDNSTSTIMQRMSSMLTRWLDTRVREAASGEERETGENEQPAGAADITMETDSHAEDVERSVVGDSVSVDQDLDERNNESNLSFMEYDADLESHCSLQNEEMLEERKGIQKEKEIYTENPAENNNIEPGVYAEEIGRKSSHKTNRESDFTQGQKNLGIRQKTEEGCSSIQTSEELEYCESKLKEEKDLASGFIEMKDNNLCVDKNKKTVECSTTEECKYIKRQENDLSLGAVKIEDDSLFEDRTVCEAFGKEIIAQDEGNSTALSTGVDDSGIVMAETNQNDVFLHDGASSSQFLNNTVQEICDRSEHLDISESVAAPQVPQIIVHRDCSSSSGDYTKTGARPKAAKKTAPSVKKRRGKVDNSRDKSPYGSDISGCTSTSGQRVIESQCFNSGAQNDDENGSHFEDSNVSHFANRRMSQDLDYSYEEEFSKSSISDEQSGDFSGEAGNIDGSATPCAIMLNSSGQIDQGICMVTDQQEVESQSGDKAVSMAAVGTSLSNPGSEKINTQSDLKQPEVAMLKEDLQLSSEADSDSSEEFDLFASNSEEDTARYPSRSMARSMAARRLQNMFRKHRQEKAQKEEQARLHRMRLPKPHCERKFAGHRNARTMIKEVNFWGDRYVVSGSDCGHVFIWDKLTGRLVNLLEGDKHVVNCVQPHPYEPILATSGIDYNIKVWSPTSSGTGFDREVAEKVVRRNEVMLAETRDTVTVPASFMLRLIASIQRVERARNQDTPEGE